MAALVSAVGSAEALKIAFVAGLEKSVEVVAVQKGLALDPWNPGLHDRLSQLYSDSLELSTRNESVRHARLATALNANKSDYWLTLASACESVHENACSDRAFHRALILSPMVPLVWWLAGDHFLRTGRPQSALQCFHHLLDLSPDYAPQTFDLTLRAYGNPRSILDNVVGDKTDPRLALTLADFLSANGEFDTAHQAWIQVAAKGSSFSFDEIRPYLDRLLNQARYEEAQAIWTYLEKCGIIAKPADSEAGNLVYNGGFEQPPLDAGFDWHLQPSPYVSVDFADPSPFEGRHCLRIDFPVRQNDEFQPVYQMVPVIPNRDYRLAAFVRSRDITSDSGPSLRVVDPTCPSCLGASTATTLGTTWWHSVTLSFFTGPQTHAVRLSVWRPRSRTFPTDISGTFWLDAVSLRLAHQPVDSSGIGPADWTWGQRMGTDLGNPEPGKSTSCLRFPGP